MARFTDADRFDDDDDIVPTVKSGLSGWAMVLLIVASVAALALIGGAVTIFGMRSAHVERAEAAANLTAARPAFDRVCTRDQFKALVGLTPEVVNTTVGPPSIGFEKGTRSTWHYRNRTMDPITGIVDPLTEVVFDRGVVVEVSFQAVEPMGKAK
jgi:hypothetical protein